MSDFVANWFIFRPQDIEFIEAECGSGTTAAGTDISIDTTGLANKPKVGDFVWIVIHSEDSGLENIDRTDTGLTWDTSHTWTYEDRPGINTAGVDNFAWCHGKTWAGGDATTITFNCDESGHPYTYCMFIITNTAKSTDGEYMTGQWVKAQTSVQAAVTAYGTGAVSVPPNGVSFHYVRNSGELTPTADDTVNYTKVKDDPTGLGTIFRRDNTSANWEIHRPSYTTVSTTKHYTHSIGLYKNSPTGSLTDPATAATWDAYYKKNTGMFLEQAQTNPSVIGRLIRSWADQTGNANHALHNNADGGSSGATYYPPLGFRGGDITIPVFTQHFDLIDGANGGLPTTSITSMELFIIWDCAGHAFAGDTSPALDDQVIYYMDRDGFSMELQIDVSTGRVQGITKDDVTTRTVTVNVDPLGKHYAFFRVADNSSMDLDVDGQTATIGTTTIGLFSAGVTHYLNRGLSGDNAHGGTVHEAGFRIDRTALTSGEKTTLRNYAKDTYGIIENGTIGGDVSDR